MSWFEWLSAAVTAAFLVCCVVWYVRDRDRPFRPLANAVLAAVGVVLLFAVVLAVTG